MRAISSSAIGALCGCALLLSGCGTMTYALRALSGEIELLSRAVPIESALNDPRLTEEEREKLALIVRARDFGEQVVGLNVNTSYRTFANLGDEPLAWNLSASPKDRFEPYLWNVPIIGWLPYLGFFSLEEAILERDRLVEQGYDTLTYEVDAFSTLGALPDPVASPLLKRDFISLADTVLHELLHNTIYRNGDSDFSESLATFVGRTASLEFLELEFGADAPIVRQARDSHEDSDRFNAFLVEMMNELSLLYASDAAYVEKLERRAAVFEAARERFKADVLPLMHDPEGYEVYGDFPFNNAFLLLNVRYNSGLDVFADVYEMTGRDWGQTLRHFSDAAAQDDPTGYLRDLAALVASP